MIKIKAEDTNSSRRRRVRTGDADFVPPDGGWGWLIIFACGFSNVTYLVSRGLCTFPMFQQFGLIFGEKFLQLDISNSEKTTVFNLHSACNACVGLLNGPAFRYFSYRQIAFFGATLVSVSLLLTTQCHSFCSYLIIYSMFYGSGIGITQSANSLALNTYFKNRRRIATGLSWSITAMGPIAWPHIINALMSVYSMEGTLLLFAAFAGNAVACSLLLQPVHWHTKFRTIEDSAEPLIESDMPDQPFRYLYDNDTSYDFTNPSTPRMVGPNDGYYSRSIMGSKLSLTTKTPRFQSLNNSVSVTTQPSYNNLSDAKKKPYTIPEEIGFEEPILTLQIAAKKLEAYKDTQIEPEKDLSFMDKVCMFFDFDLLKDATYLNLMLGITVANFAELNFSILTPIVLKEFEFDDYQVAMFMSLLGAVDIVVRLVAPFLAVEIGWDNKTFFLVGVLSMAFGRIVLVHTQTYYFGLLVAVIIGFGKGLRTIFMALIIPSYVPFERLPAASGLQLTTSGLLFLVLGPIVGWVRDLVNNYVITLHLLNIMTYITTLAWTWEKFNNTSRIVNKK